MIVDQTLGTIVIPGRSEVISAELTRSAFLSSPSASTASVCVKNEPWCSWDLTPTVIDEQKWYVRLLFKTERLTSVELTLGDVRASRSWVDWSKEKELARKAQHDKLLFCALGSPPYDFVWGRVLSVFDERSGGSRIIVEYGKR